MPSFGLLLGARCCKLILFLLWSDPEFWYLLVAPHFISDLLHFYVIFFVFIYGCVPLEVNDMSPSGRVIMLP